MGMQQLCTMCDQFYSDSVRHKVMDCYFYVGCACGMRPATKKHVEGCFMARVRARKDREETARRPLGPLIQNSDYRVDITCVYCFRVIYSTKEEHEAKFCSYHLGCPMCGEKKKDYQHVTSCKKRKEASVPDEIELVCRYCRSNVPMSKWDKHMSDQCGPKALEGVIEETQNLPRLALLPRLITPPQDMVNCALCGSSIVRTYIESHEARCKEQIKTKFGFTTYFTGEPKVIDMRRTPSLKDLREVTFVEEVT